MKLNILKNYIGLFIILTLLIIPQSACTGKEEKEAPVFQRSDYYLDTICDITLYGVNKAKVDNDSEEKKIAENLMRDAFALIKKQESILSMTIEDSEIQKINRAKGKPVKVSPETLGVIEKGLYYGELSRGAFDISCGRITDLWDFHEGDEETHQGGSLPKEKALKEAVTHTDYKKIFIDKEASTVTLLDEEMELNLGGIAKGYIADRVAKFLEEKGVNGAIVNLGGNIVTIGGKPKGFFNDGNSESFEPFILGVKNPLVDTGELLGTFSGKDTTIVTSGTYERYFEKNGVKYHHILNTKTGWPCDTEVLQVTIIAPKGFSGDCDGLSTACLAMGVEKGLKLIKTVNRNLEKSQKIEAIFIEEGGAVTCSNENTAFHFS